MIYQCAAKAKDEDLSNLALKNAEAEILMMSKSESVAQDPSPDRLLRPSLLLREPASALISPPTIRSTLLSCRLVAVFSVILLAPILWAKAIGAAFVWDMSANNALLRLEMVMCLRMVILVCLSFAKNTQRKSSRDTST